jgi:triosephosphate isomerase
MRQQIVAGNWKMNNSLSIGVELAATINKMVLMRENNSVKVLLAPPFIHLSEVCRIVDKDRISVAGQNCACEPEGAFTGEVSAKMIKSTGADYVIIGHSERRMYFNESDNDLVKKLTLALENDLKPIFCCGEKLPEREAGNHFQIVRNQLAGTVFTFKTILFKRIIIAYEPVWAIGTGVNAKPQQAQEMHSFIRGLISDKYGSDIATRTPVLYGGSCKASNAKELFANPDVDGGLIGGASLDPNEFVKIVYSF